ncbi:hypothetical protein NLX83_10475 [Allokutzneria sp. A3M-2-11 16]|uniref:hypothetical protein n=1 Tax=Allokutzneria sp. A3M-2-11 16 TaxID=2962043 RepID=UPI0020B7DB9B|nr:hypothetical protein [Allokutzneria sp. A3M-2-11 16]MCP3799682.1 hypothetical protein [Allokutzneria sp. A3M-2-11 16]
MTTVPPPSTVPNVSTVDGKNEKPLLRFGVPVGVAVLVAVLAQIPVLVNRVFYYWDDSAAQFLPMWYRLGQRLMSGDFPLLLDTEAWIGGNLTAEAMFGVWNPVNLLNYLLVASFDDLASAGAVVKAEFLVILALGVYFLAREYGASRWAASAVAVALPFSGFTLYFEASIWIAGLMAFAWVPHFWWAARKLARGRVGTIWPFLFGALCVTVGNPYGLLGVGLVLLVLMIEFRARKVIVRLFALGATVGGAALLVFLPLLGNSKVSWRNSKELFNNTQLVPSLQDYLGSSLPSYVPDIHSFSTISVRMTFPAMYLAWFVVPLLAWLDWSVLRQRWRQLLGVLVIGGVYLVATLGPSNFWMFRWPLRLVEYFYLAVMVLFAVLLSAGLRRDHVRRRAWITAGALAFTAYLSFSSWPKIAAWHVVSVLLLGVLIALSVIAFRRGGSRPLVAVLHVGTAAALLLQMVWFPINRDVAPYGFPSSVAELKTFASRYPGTMVQVADRDPVIYRGKGQFLEPDTAVWRDLLFGNVYRVAGVDTTTSYSGMGFKPFHKALCLNDYGGAKVRECPGDTFANLWAQTPAGVPLADLIKARTIVVQRALIDSPHVPPGWTVAERTNFVTVLRRERDMPDWGAARLSRTTPGMKVLEDTMPAQHKESVTFERGTAQGPLSLTFARLNWPGYKATVDGKPVEVRNGPGGLVTVDLPADVSAGRLSLTWTPPGLWIGVGGAAVGLLAALALTIVQRRRR